MAVRLRAWVLIVLALALAAGGVACGESGGGDDDDDDLPGDDDLADDDSAAEDDDSGEDTVVTEDADTLTIARGELAIRVWKQPFGWQLRGAGDEVVAESYAYAEKSSFFYRHADAVHYLAEYLSWRRVEGGVAISYRTTENRAARTTVAFLTDATIRVGHEVDDLEGTTRAGQDVRLFGGEAIYGLAERIHWNRDWSETDPREIGSLDRRGEWLPMTLVPTISVVTPFYHSGRGYGLYVDTTYPGEFDLGHRVGDRLRFDFQADATREPMFAYYLFHGPGHDAILDEYTALTGRPFVPPRWAFKHWRWRDEHEVGKSLLDGHSINAQVAEDLTKYEQYGFPVGSYMIDRPYTPGEQGFAEFAWDPERFPNAEDMRESLFSRGYHLIVWGAPWAIGSDQGQNGAEAAAGGYYAPGSTTHIDFSNPDAYDWWKEKVRAFAAANGIHGWKLDRGDENQPSRSWAIYADGRTGTEMRNAYPLLYHQCYFDAMRAAWGEDFVNIIRTGWAGSQAYGVPWGGDTAGAVGAISRRRSTDLGLRSAILSQLHMAFMGFPLWGSDTGGYYEFRDRDVFARWIEFSAFCPLMEIGGTGSHAPWDMPTRPHFDTEMIEIYRTYTELHHALVDYLYEQAKEAGRTGRAVVRPLVFEYPDDEVVTDIWDEYFVGPDLLVAPVWRTGERQRDVYIPAGRFVDFWNEAVTIDGPTWITVAAPLDRIPVFVREGAERAGRVRPAK